MEIKIKENTRDLVRTIDRVGLMAGSFKDISMRTKDDLVDIFGKDEGSYEYAPGVIRTSMSGGVRYAAGAGANMIRYPGRDKTSYPGEDIESIRQSNTVKPEVIPEAVGTNGSIRQSGMDRIGRTALERQTRYHMADDEVLHTTEESRLKGRVKWREAYKDDGTILKNPEGIGATCNVSPKGDHISHQPSSDLSFINSQIRNNSEELVFSRQKQYAISRLRKRSFDNRILPVSAATGKSSKVKHVNRARRLARDVAERVKLLFTSFTTGTAIALVVVMVLVFCGAAFTITGDENGDYFAYDLYGIGPGDTAIVKVAEAQLGNVGGDKFWRWIGFTGHVEWCACFVSWCAGQCGYIDAGIIPKYAVCGDGANWFKTHHRWASRGYAPKPGDIIFFDFEQDGHIDHTGIVESCDGRTLTTIEGNVSNVCRRLTHAVGSRQIAGYGVPGYNSGVISGNASAWATMIAGDNSYHYVHWDPSDSRTHECPVCNDHPAGAYRGWNCIGFTFACWHHGAGIRCRCSCGVISDAQWNQLLSCSTDAEASRLATRLVGVPCTVIRNSGNAIPRSMMKKGDILGLYNSSGYYHTIFYEGNGKYADCTSGRSDNIQAGNTLPAMYKSQIKIAIRFIG